MKTQFLREILSSLSWHAFSAYVRELFTLRDTYKGNPLSIADNSGYPEITELETIDLSHNVAENTFEQQLQQGLEHSYHKVVFVHPLPVELLADPLSAPILDPGFRAKIESYKERSEKRESEWVYTAMGRLDNDVLALVSNTHSVSKEVYTEKLLTEFAGILEHLEYDAVPVIGSIDSFLDLAKSDAEKALVQFIDKYHGNLTVSLSGEKLEVSEAIPYRYITSGVLRASLDPCEPVLLHRHERIAELIAEFERIINGNRPENQLEGFLKAHYQEIFGFKYDRIESQLWLRFPELDIAGKSRRMDIFLRNRVEKDWDLFELKRSVRLTRTYRDVPVLTGEILSAIQQVKNYSSILSQNIVRKSLLRQGIEYFQPSLHLVVGSSPEIPIEQWRWLKATHRNDVKLITYDELLQEMKTRFDLYNKAFE